MFRINGFAFLISQAFQRRRRPSAFAVYILIVAMLVSLFLLGGAFKTSAAEPVRIMLDGKYLAMDVPPVNKSGRLLVPVRAVFERLGASFSWDDAGKSAGVSLAPYSVVLTMNAKTAVVDDEKVALDVPAQIIEGRVLVPLRFVSESFGFEVELYNNVVLILTEDAEDLSAQDCKDLIDGKPISAKTAAPTKTEGYLIVTSPVKINNPALVTLSAGVPNRDYRVHVYYKSGESAAKGLGEKRADAEGNVFWTWRVGGRTAPGIYHIMVETVTAATHEEFEITFEVVK